MMKYMIILLSLIFSMGSIQMHAQEKAEKKKEEKKVVIVKEVTDENGNTVVEKKVLEGKEAEAYMKEMEEKEIEVIVEVEEGKRKHKKHMKNKLHGEHREMEKQVWVNVEGDDEKAEKTIEIRVKGEEGEEKIMKWNGEGEMPEEMKEHMEGVKIRIENSEGNQVEIIRGRGDNKVEILEWESDDEIDEETKEKLLEKGVKIKDGNIIIYEGNDRDRERKRIRIRRDHDDEEMDEIIFIEKEESMKAGKPRLGVMIENHVDGLEIVEVMDGTPAAEAGLQSGDIIYKVGEKYIGSVLQLNAALDNAGEKEFNIHYLRDGEEMKTKAKL